MKLNKKILYTIGLTACAGMLYTAACMASDPAAPAYDEDTYGPQKMVVWNKPVPRVVFSHKVHTMDAGLECDACHDDIFQMEAGNAENNDDFTMKGFSEGKYCGTCHDGSTAFSTDNADKCGSCHTPPGTIVFTKPVKSVVFDHKKHVDDLGFNCTNCHSDVFKMNIGAAEQNESTFTMKALYSGKYCGSCHNGQDAFASNTSCTTCHIGVMGFDRLFGDANAKKKAEHE